MEGKTCILKDFFLWHEPNCTQKGQNCIQFWPFECNRVKRKTMVLSKDIKIIFFAIFSYFFKL